MFCTRCGSGLAGGAAYCRVCGAPVTGAGAPQVVSASLERPGVVIILAILQFFGAAVLLAGAAFGLLAASEADSQFDMPMAAVVAVCLALGVFYITCGVGLLKLRPYGRTMQIIGAVIGLLGFPLGTIISIAILVYMFKPGVKVLFSGKTPAELTPQEAADVAAVRSGGGAAIVIAVVLIALVVVAVLGIIAAIAIPGLLRARIAGNEASAIGTLRSIVSAETSYSATINGGYYDTLPCLATPASCVQGYSGTSFIQEAYSERSGYRYELTGEPAPADRASTTSRSSLATYVVLATPISASTGTRVFCVDQTGTIRAFATATPPTGITACPASWPPID
jgi:type IV pilus assembly protein PilA